MPKIEQTIADVNVRTHSLQVLTPSTRTILSTNPNPASVSREGDDGVGQRASEELGRGVAVESAVIRAIALAILLLVPAAATAQTQDRCRLLCEPVFLIEPTITFEKDATVFETIFALDLSTPIPRLGITLERSPSIHDENESSSNQR